MEECDCFYSSGDVTWFMACKIFKLAVETTCSHSPIWHTCKQWCHVITWLRVTVIKSHVKIWIPFLWLNRLSVLPFELLTDCLFCICSCQMEFLFGRRKTPEEMLRQNQRALNRAMRDLDRERQRLEQQEKKIIADIKKMAKQGQMVRQVLMTFRCS